MSMNTLHISKLTLELTAPAFLLIGLAHCVAIARVIQRSYTTGKRVLQATTATKASTSTSRCVGPFTGLCGLVSRAWAWLFSPTGFFGFSNPHFDTVFMVREAWEIVMQTYQAYQLSLSVPRKWINQLAVATIVLNCISSPLVHLVLHKKPTLRRVFNLVQDAFLDFCCSVVIPLSVFLPYVRLYDTTRHQFPDELTLNDVWYVNAISEIRQVLVTSFPDFVSTIMPQLSLFGYLMTFKNILRRRSPRIHEGPTLRDTQAFTHAPPSVRSLDRHGRNTRQLLVVAVHMAFVLWGCGVLVLHSDASRTAAQHAPGCQLHVSAWHSSRFPCSVMLLNCHMERMNGSDKEVSGILELLERSSLQVLVLSHCPALHVPPVVTEFNSLVGIELFNCTLVDWPAEAALHQAMQPSIGYVHMIRTNWTAFPAGLLHDQLPALLTRVSIFASNMTTLPDEIERWSERSWTAVLIADAPNLQNLPASFCRINTAFLWLINTGVSVLPGACVANSRLVELKVSRTPLLALPNVVGPNLQILYAEHTAVSSLPPWFSDWYRHTPPQDVAFYGSPICNSTAALCHTDQHTASTYYPWEIMLRFRQYQLPFGPPPPF